MKTYLRCPIHVSTMEYPFKAPEHVQKAADELKERCEQYRKNTDINYLIPIDSKEYEEVLAFAKEYKSFFHSNLFYQHKFTKKEMNEANYYLLECSGTQVELLYEENEIYAHCCKDSHCRKKQIGNYRIKKSSIKNRVITMSYDGRYIISKELKEVFEKEQLTNLKLLPVYDIKGIEIVAYQMEAANTLPPLAEINGWNVYKECGYCKEKRWHGIYGIAHPFYIPIDWDKELGDINMTSEVFSDSDSRYYIISKKMYEILLSMQAKKLACEPIILI